MQSPRSRPQSPRSVGHLASQCGQAPVAKENVFAARAAAPEVVWRTTKDDAQFPAATLGVAQESRSVAIPAYTKGICDVDPLVKRLTSCASDPAGEAHTPKPMASPRETRQTEAFSGQHILPGMASSTSATVLFSRSCIWLNYKEEEQKSVHEDREEDKHDAKEEIGQAYDVEAQASTDICEDREEGSELAALRDDLAEIEQRLCMVRQRLGEDAALPFFGPLSVVQRGLSALEIWQRIEETRQSLQG